MCALRRPTGSGEIITVRILHLTAPILTGSSRAPMLHSTPKTRMKMWKDRTGFTIGLIGWLTINSLVGAEWPQFRGPTGDGRSEARGLPLQWDEETHVRWKSPVHGLGWSSPVVWGDQIWLTTATEDGHQLYAVCLSVETGQVVHDLLLFEVAEPQFVHRFNSHASPTPVLEEGRVYVTFGATGTAALDSRTGRVLWERRDIECNHFRGAGSSPILHEGLLLMHFDGSDHQFVMALDKDTGRTVWRRDRSIDFMDLGPDGKPEEEGDLRKAFATPHVARFHGKPLWISQGAKAIYAYDPLDGAEWWRVEERLNHSASSRPVVGDGLIFVNTGWATGQLLALRPGHRGEVLDANAAQGELQAQWEDEDGGPGGGVEGAPQRAAQAIVAVGGGVLVWDCGRGIASCWEARTGHEIWQERVGGNYSASPIAAEGRIYVFSEEGKTTVFEAGREFRVLAENRLDDGFMASPAVAGRSLILRTRSSVYRVETQEGHKTE
jgi:outer membrane protein assembly factor BamB